MAVSEDRRYVYTELKLRQRPVASRHQIRALDVAITVMLIGAAVAILAVLLAVTR